MNISSSEHAEIAESHVQRWRNLLKKLPPNPGNAHLTRRGRCSPTQRPRARPQSRKEGRCVQCHLVSSAEPNDVSRGLREERSQ